MTGLSDSRRAASLAAATVLAVTAALAGESVEIRFSFEGGAKARYEISLDLDVTTVAELDEQKVSNRAKTAVKLVMDTVARAAEGEPPQLAVTFSGLEVDQTIEGPAGKINVEIRGEDVKVDKDSLTVIDTKGDKGKELAGAFLAEFAFVGRESTLVMDASGRVAEVRGPKEFTDFLAASAGPGLFLLEAPEGPVKVGETWQAERSEIKRLKGIDLSANPLVVKTSFTLEGIDEKTEEKGEEREKGGRRLARISVNSPLKEGGKKDTGGAGGDERDDRAVISANMSNEAGVERYVTITSLERTATGTVLFDLEKGVVVESDLDVTIAVRMEIKEEGEDVRYDMTGTAKIATKLVPVPAAEEPAEAGPAEPEGGEAKGGETDE